jgi:hypothetical protein
MGTGAVWGMNISFVHLRYSEMIPRVHLINVVRRKPYQADLRGDLLMPSTEWNKGWEGHDWSQRGAEWSSAWGGVETHWFATIFPRSHNFVPTGSLLEIAPGYGRWTEYLLPLCTGYIGVDLVQVCIDACRCAFR